VKGEADDNADRAQEAEVEVVAICGSPREDGNTATLIEAMLEGARESGAETTRFDPTKMQILDCIADDECLKGPDARCILEDDMGHIYDALRRAEAWVLGTPVYHGHLTGTLKRVIDRLYAFYTSEGGQWRLALEGERKGGVIVVQADRGLATPERVAEYLEEVLRAYNVEPIGRVLGCELLKRGDAAAHPDMVAQARDLGRELASE
jgi:multimeric flavodoxin WrbA